MTTDTVVAKPTLIYDGDCGFCRAAIERWREATGARIEYGPSQDLGARFPDLDPAEFDAAVVLVEPDGKVRRGAGAVFRAMALADCKQLPWRIYDAIPPFAWAADLAYRLVAKNRRIVTGTLRLWFGGTLERPTYHLSSALFLRLLGVVYLVAFASLGLQIVGLVGESGLLPAGPFLERVDTYYEETGTGQSPQWNYPTLAWLSTSDGFLRGLCIAGVALSALLVAGLAPMPILLLLWTLYLSLFWIGQTFLSFQWDILLLEIGFLAIFVAPSTLRSRLFGDRHPPRLALFLVWWLLFRLMLESGLVKLTWDNPYPPEALGPNGNTWENLTALDYHYWTQPLPLWTSWFAAKLPALVQKASVLGVYLIEILLPFFIFGPRRLRHVAFVGICFFMVLINGTGNYNFFNLLTVVLAVTLLDDRVFPQSLRDRIRGADLPALASPTRRRSFLLVPLAAFVVLLGGQQVLRAGSPPGPGASPSLESRLGLRQFVLVNDYGLFRSMTETRPEIVIEGSRDGLSWQPYEFRWKPGDLSQRPRFTGPHQPRLDWQMWFEALNLERIHQQTGRLDPRAMSPWFQSLLVRLREGESTVTSLLEHNPFEDVPPARLRVLLYQYRFTTADEKRETGDWWHRELVWTEVL